MTADKLRQMRREMGLSRRELAAMLGVSWRSVEAWELGRKIPESQAKFLRLFKKHWKPYERTEDEYPD